MHYIFINISYETFANVLMQPPVATIVNHLVRDIINQSFYFLLKGVIHMEIGSRIKEQRELKNWSQDELAEILNISRQSISKWELNKVYPSIDMLIKMSDLFDVSLDELIKGDKDLKKTIIETYQQPVSTQSNNHPMNGWEFLARYWWLFFPVAGVLWWMIQTFI